MTNATDEMTLAERQSLMQDLDMRHMLGNDMSQIEGFIFQDMTDSISPGRRRVSVWSMETGEEIRVRRYRLEDFLRKRDERGKRRFTLDPSEAPQLVLGQYKCLLAANSEERLAGELTQAGLLGVVVCPAEHLQSAFARDEHLRKSHKQSWRVWNDYQNRKRDDEYRVQQTKQMEAMLTLAQSASDAKAANRPECPECGWVVPSRSKNIGASLRMHRKHAHGEGNGEEEAEETTTEGSA